MHLILKNPMSRRGKREKCQLNIILNSYFFSFSLSTSWYPQLWNICRLLNNRRRMPQQMLMTGWLLSFCRVISPSVHSYNCVDKKLFFSWFVTILLCLHSTLFYLNISEHRRKQVLKNWDTVSHVNFSTWFLKFEFFVIELNNRCVGA